MALRFKDLEEGKKYVKKDGTVYEKRNGLLWWSYAKEYSNLSMSNVAKMRFEPYVEYHTLEEAWAWMEKGNHTISPDGERCIIDEGMISDKPNSFLCITKRILEPKWVLLGKDD